jgi:hypothetical protein
VVCREILFNLLFVYLIVLFFHQVVVIALIPTFQLGILITSLLPFEILQDQKLFLALAEQLLCELLLELLHIDWIFGHPYCQYILRITTES